MKPSPLDYHRPTSVPQAVDTLSRLGDDGKVLAGGQSLVPMLSMRIAAPAALVDINALPGLDTVTVTDDVVRVGALVRHSRLEHDEQAFAAQPLLRRTLQHVAHPTIRNRGTTVGSIAHADPSAEFPAVLALLGGRVVAAEADGAGGVRELTLDAADFFAGPLECALTSSQLAVAVEFPRARPGEGTAVVELARRHGDYAVCGTVVQVRLDGDLVTAVRAAYVSAGDLGVVVDLTEGAGPVAVADLDVDALAARAQELVETDTDIHASADYRSHLVGVLTGRAVREALADATGGTAPGSAFGRPLEAASGPPASTTTTTRRRSR